MHSIAAAHRFNPALHYAVYKTFLQIQYQSKVLLRKSVFAAA